VLLLAIDIGTESLRAGLVTPEGRVLATARQPYTTRFPQPQWAEQDPEDWWRAAQVVVRDCLSQAGVASAEVEAIGLDAFASTLVVTDAEGRPLRPAILWMDARATAEAEAIERTGDPVLRYGGGQESVEWMLPRLLWLKRHEPETYASARWMVEALDWFTFQLTGQWTLSLCQLTDLWHYVPSLGGWPRSLLSAVGLEQAQTRWPERILAIGDRAGALTPAAAQALGLVAGIPVAAGGIDAHVGLLGLDALRPGQLGLILGSSSVQLTLTERPVFDPGFWGPFEDTILRGRWLLEMGQVSTGSILRWYKDNMAPPAVHDEAAARGLSVYAYLDSLADQLAPGSGGLVALDYWQGNRTPLRDPLARGALVGLTLYHTPAHVYRALLEAAAFGNRHILEALDRAGAHISQVRASGGGAQSEVWLQMHADVANTPVTITSSEDACLVGCAVAAAVCVGVYPDLLTAASRMVRPVRTYEPDPDRHAAYGPPYALYRDLYPALRPVFQRIAASRARA
jgi:FGGY-family pentulose kinase